MDQGRVAQEHAVPAGPNLRGASYIGRYKIFFERMVKEGNYDTAALLTAEAGSEHFIEPF
ncbi:PaeR7I family type II restriction endonuclease [Streptomyces sp. NPDC088733]|uniref:PaeR7I family type II restriction endonuclease n=1 Tax=Streptomyces sp. NPDC088733 TaxID=3365880 RepID=UPI00381D1E1C